MPRHIAAAFSIEKAIKDYIKIKSPRPIRYHRMSNQSFEVVFEYGVADQAHRLVHTSYSSGESNDPEEAAMRAFDSFASRFDTMMSLWTYSTQSGTTVVCWRQLPEVMCCKDIESDYEYWVCRFRLSVEVVPVPADRLTGMHEPLTESPRE